MIKIMQKKKIVHRVRLGENDLLFLWQALSYRESAMLLMLIVRSKDAQCKTEESP